MLEQRSSVQRRGDRGWNSGLQLLCLLLGAVAGREESRSSLEAAPAKSWGCSSPQPALSQESHTDVLSILVLTWGFIQKGDCVALGELWISPMEQLGNKAGLCISQYRLGSSNLVWLEKVSAFSSSLLFFNLLPHLGTAPYLVTCVSAVLSLLFIKVMQRGYAWKLFLFSELAWHHDRLSPFAVLENVCLQ